MTPTLCIELHDVAPATWPQCARLLGMLDELGHPPLTLLAVPDYHGRGRLRCAAQLVRSVQQRIDGGDEVALHGYFHRDDAASPRQAVDRLRRRVLTAGEGEFAALAHDEAARRIRRGWNELSDVFCPLRGFVAPAWLSGAGTWTALRQSPLQYAATRDALIVLDGMRCVAAPAITVSARTRWRRIASRAWMRLLARVTDSAPLLRVALHPVDADHPRVMDDWRALLQSLLRQRTPLTTASALGLVRLL